MKATKKVLVVDDDPVVGTSFDRVLSGKGYAVIHAPDGKAALDRMVRRLEAAALVLSTYGLVHNIRTLDAIHLATAIAIHSQRPLAGFVAADKKLLEVASESCGLQVIEV